MPAQRCGEPWTQGRADVDRQAFSSGSQPWTSDGQRYGAGPISGELSTPGPKRRVACLDYKEVSY